MEIAKFVSNEITVTHHTDTDTDTNGIKSVVTLENTEYGIKTDYYRGNDTERAKRSYSALVELTNRLSK